MMNFIPPKRKLLELLVLVVLALIFYFIYPSFEAITLFVFGFIWNWAASNDLSMMLDNNRYRMSMLKLVSNLQTLILRPFGWAPDLVKRFIRILPAGLFWLMVIFINDSVMPWWAPFVGSFAFELLQLEINFIKGHKDLP